MSRAWLILLLLLAMVGAYHMPWMLHKTAVFTYNAFDLAEGASLHPTIRAESPSLLTPLWLRLPLVLIGMMIAVASTQLHDERWRWIWRGVAVLVVMRLNPPIDFYPFGDTDPNYNQLGYLMLTGLGSIGVVILLGRFVKPLAMPLLLIGLVFTLYSALRGHQSAIGVFESVGLALETGGGLMLFVALTVGVAGLAIWQLIAQYGQRQQKRQDHYPAFLKETIA